MLRSGNGSASVIRDRMEENLASSSPKRNFWTFESSLSLSISAAAAHVHAPSSWYGIISGRTLCSNESRGNFSCATGDCESNKIEWPGSYGWSTVTYIYFRIDYSGTNSYFISLEYGYNLPVMVVPSHSSPTCFSSGCMVGLNKTCPNKLMIYDGIIPIACSSACKESSTHENC
ncbi:PREDICTED: thaumatin-like protein 1 [Brassica oleracea var. oleracea]|uniref:thaumatin-like protein 1 n=1 Tax=Brassica oleracea var. oleracea TaxID=109376 RepID=UPI0006A6A70A|nr:PREDICTED: thaumatin-like protein 1 [Brassica oleracea var. oleracea]